MSTTIISPAFNVENQIKEFVTSCITIVDQIVVINDGSTDNTFRYLEDLKMTSQNVHVIQKKQNKGKSEAVLTGIKYVLNNLSDTKHIIQMDADLAHSPIDLAMFLKENTLTDMVVGNRYSNYGLPDEHRSCVMHLASEAIATATGFKLHDPMCGYRRYSTKIASIFAENLGQHGYGIETEQLILCSLHKYTVCEQDLVVVIPQDIKTKAIEFIDVFNALIVYSKLLKIPNEFVRIMKDSVNNLVDRKNFMLSLTGKNILFQYVPYKDSYTLKWQPTNL